MPFTTMKIPLNPFLQKGEAKGMLLLRSYFNYTKNLIYAYLTVVNKL